MLETWREVCALGEGTDLISVVDGGLLWGRLARSWTVRGAERAVDESRKEEISSVSRCSMSCTRF